MDRIHHLGNNLTETQAVQNGIQLARLIVQNPAPIPRRPINIREVVQKAKLQQYLAVKRVPTGNWQLLNQFSRWLDLNLLNRTAGQIRTFEDNHRFRFSDINPNYRSSELYRIFLQSQNIQN